MEKLASLAHKTTIIIKMILIFISLHGLLMVNSVRTGELITKKDSVPTMPLDKLGIRQFSQNFI
jgi:hypothetical protein